ncbi:conjugal transfer protein TraS [Klebsiella grimontii]|uniref:conjugal transfer protein TraS n=1 Tax=Klebsiella grimontii TaxID=2058152 RepID=UPI002246CF4D|nr:conjugal transfer protein TraS [Klebsiella grimontii]MCW9474413.1 conjugal transfer protein TraS [Klebsiella grimontii]
MITNKIVIKEVDELKSVLSQGNAEIPSFWVCIWPGFFLAVWNVFCAVISVRSEYLDVKYMFWVLVFPGAIGLIILLGVANARSLFLSVPKSFRKKSVVYDFFTKKLIVYAFVYMMMVMLLAFYNRFFYDSPFPYAFMILLTTVVLGFVMNLDFGRYQLSLLTSAINTFKTEKLGG